MTPIVYHGTSAVTLYLQAYQLILWKQCYTLIHTIGLPADLEQVVKDLWALRLQLVRSKVDVEESDGDTVFSSQPVSDMDATTDTDQSPRRQGKAMPILVESLGVCYLAAMILRLPISMGELHE